MIYLLATLKLRNIHYLNLFIFSQTREVLNYKYLIVDDLYEDEGTTSQGSADFHSERLEGELRNLQCRFLCYNTFMEFKW